MDVLACPHCGGRLRLIATLHDPVVIWKLLAHLGMARSGPSPERLCEGAMVALAQIRGEAVPQERDGRDAGVAEQTAKLKYC
jgi:uncharacterized protein YbaR (Trm112 family)